MSAICPKCAYVRRDSDSNPDWQCPACGVAYAKVMPKEAEELPLLLIEEQAPPRRTPRWPIASLLFLGLAFGALFWLLEHLPATDGGEIAAYARRPAGPPALELSAEEVASMLEPNSAAGPKSGHENNPALEQHYFKTETSGGFEVRVRPKLTQAAMAQLRHITAERIVLFGTRSCTYCGRARRYFSHEKIPFADLDVERDARARDFELNVLQTAAYPVFVIDGEVMYGYNPQELVRALREL